MKKIKLLFMDIDGTLTDGKIYIGESGEVCKAFNVKDGYGIRNILAENDIIPIIITARESKIVSNRCFELNIEHVYQGCTDKRTKMIELAAEYGLNMNSLGVIEGVAYIGDDILDLQCIDISQYSGCPADAVHEVKKAVDFIANVDGGNGAVRDFIEWLVSR